MENVLTSTDDILSMSTRVEQAARREAPRLLNFIRRRVASQEDAEDILQDVFYGLLSSYSVTDPIERLTAWLFHAARNRIIDWYRKKKPDSVQDIEETVGANPEEMLFDTSTDPDRMYVQSMLWEHVMEALDDLPAEQRDVFVWNEIEGKSFREIAEKTGEPINTLLSRKRYAVLRLREALREDYNDLHSL